MGIAILNISSQAANDAAIKALEQHEVYRAQTLFQHNAKINPCFMTFNNLGAFHTFEGLLKPDDSGRGANKLGAHYLKKAELLQKSELTLFAFGCMYFAEKDYEKASDFFRQASELKADYTSVYNCAVANYMHGKYTEAVKWFQKALDICDTVDYSETFISYVFSLFYSDRQEFLEASQNILEINDENIIWEKFIFKYFANDIQRAESLIKPMLKHFNVDLQVMAIVFDCLLKLGKYAEAKEYLKQKVEALEESDYNMQPEINRMKKALSHDEYRSKLITEYKHNIPIIKQCCYYGCKLHNPL